LSTLLTSFPYSFSVVRRSDGEDFKRLRVSLSRRKPSRRNSILFDGEFHC
jgi:hypothetical protein